MVLRITWRCWEGAAFWKFKKTTFECYWANRREKEIELTGFLGLHAVNLCEGSHGCWSMGMVMVPQASLGASPAGLDEELSGRVETESLRNPTLTPPERE